MISKSVFLRIIFTMLLAIGFSLGGFFLAELTAKSAPGLTLQPPSGRAAAALKITGAGFQPGEEVDIIMQTGDVFHGLGTEKADVIKADEKGNFEVTTGIPVRTPPGRYHIEATGNRGSIVQVGIEVLR